MRSPVFLAAAVLAAFATGGVFRSAPSLSAGPNADEAAAIREILEAQDGAWNRGELESFMATYWKSDDLSFYSGGEITHGWKATLERYRKRYQSEGREMGKLNFEDLKVDILSKDHGLARGKWKLTFKDGKTAGGLFTLILKKIDGGWKIVHDHTSAKTPS